ncbi:MAG: alpha/beta hydrolase [Candidatus Colwellbacteria bacterium]
MGTMKILILHGWNYSTDKWAPCLKLLESHGARPELLKIPGLTAPIDRPWTLEDYVRWLKEKTGDEKVILIGHSNGGRISLAFALKYPELVERLILIDSAGIRHRGGLIEIKRFLFGGLAKAGRRITASEKARNALHKLARVSDYKDATPEMRETMVNLISTDLTPELTKIKAPTLIIWGGEDRTTPPSDGKLMNKLIPNSKLHIIKDARHSPQFTHPHEVCEKIARAIKQ